MRKVGGVVLLLVFVALAGWARHHTPSASAAAVAENLPPLYQPPQDFQPDAAEALQRGSSLYHGQRYPESLAAFRQALERQPELLQVRLYMAGAYARMDNLTQAQLEVTRALEAQPGYADAWNSRAYFRACGNVNLPEALEDVQRALLLRDENIRRQRPFIGNALDTRGCLFQRAGRFEEARKDIFKALAMVDESNRAVIEYHLAQALYALSELPRAQAALTRGQFVFERLPQYERVLFVPGFAEFAAANPPLPRLVRGQPTWERLTLSPEQVLAVDGRPLLLVGDRLDAVAELLGPCSGSDGRAVWSRRKSPNVLTRTYDFPSGKLFLAADFNQLVTSIRLEGHDRITFPIRGTVLTPDGRPLPRAGLQLMTWNGPILAETVSGADGRYQLDYPSLDGRGSSRSKNALRVVLANAVDIPRTSWTCRRRTQSGAPPAGLRSPPVHGQLRPAPEASPERRRQEEARRPAQARAGEGRREPTTGEISLVAGRIESFQRAPLGSGHETAERHEPGPVAGPPGLRLQEPA